MNNDLRYLIETAIQTLFKIIVNQDKLHKVYIDIDKSNIVNISVQMKHPTKDGLFIGLSIAAACDVSRHSESLYFIVLNVLDTTSKQMKSCGIELVGYDLYEQQDEEGDVYRYVLSSGCHRFYIPEEMFRAMADFQNRITPCSLYPSFTLD